MDLNTGIALVSMIAGVAGAYFAYVAVRGHVRRRPSAAPSWPEREREGDGRYDAFISYADADEGRAEWLAAGLAARGLHVFLARWIGAGLVEYAERERALADSANGILLLSMTTMSQPDIRDEYAALLRQVHTGGRRFVPVLVEKIDKADLPPFIAIRKPLNLVDHNDSQAALDELAEALMKPARP
jgi:hypothetical protein